MTNTSRLKCRTLETWHGERTKRPSRSNFDSTWTQTRNLLETELRMIGARNAVLELKADQAAMRNDGWPYANARVDAPVRISFDSKHGTLAYQCDRFNTWQDNVRAIALALEALRKVDRYGVSNEGQQYTGWKQLEQESPSLSRLQELAELAGFTPDEAARMTSEDLCRSAKRASHPDAGGTAVKFRRVMELCGG